MIYIVELFGDFEDLETGETNKGEDDKMDYDDDDDGKVQSYYYELQLNYAI